MILWKSANAVKMLWILIFVRYVCNVFLKCKMFLQLKPTEEQLDSIVKLSSKS